MSISNIQSVTRGTTVAIKSLFVKYFFIQKIYFLSSKIQQTVGIWMLNNNVYIQLGDDLLYLYMYIHTQLIRT